jgi:hypothetical protein
MGGRVRLVRRAVVLTTAAVVVTLAVPGIAEGLPAVQVTEVAGGLLNPRGVAVGADGSVYVAEAGAGGAVLAEALVEGEPGWVCVGDSGGVTRLDRRGNVTRLGGLPSLAGAGQTPTGDPTCEGSGFAAVGPHDVAVEGRGTLAVTLGLGGDEGTRAGLPGDAATRMGTLERLLPNGMSRPIADLVAYEQANNPDGEVPDSNPYGAALLPDGSRLVVDAGGNDLLRVWPNGHVETVATFGRNVATTVPALSCGPIPGFPPPGVPIPAQAVPTTVVAHGNHAYVGFLGGFPFTPGMTRIAKVDLATGDVTTVADGLTAIVGMDVAADGTIYAVEMVRNGLLEGEICGDLAGRLVKIVDGDVTEVELPEPLMVPGGVAVAADGTLYVTVGSIFPGFGALLAIRGA